MGPTLTGEAAREVKLALRTALAEFRADSASTVDPTVQRAVFLARQLQDRAAGLQTPQERRQQAELDSMLQSPQDKATLLDMTDQAFRAALPQRSADQLIHILDVQGVPRFFSAFEQAMLKGFQSFGAYLPGVAMPLVKEKMRHETANVVLPAEEDLLREHLEQRRRAGLRMNVNILGEALLGEQEAQRRLQMYLQALARPEIEVMSVKISTIFSQIWPLARQHAVNVLCDRLELLYRAAAKNEFRRADGTATPKFLYLDMEEYRDKEITADAFMRTLDRPGLDQAPAGIALQAYMPDSFATQQRITQWAQQRVGRGAAPVTIRLVKGANMEMERVDASLHGWPLATFSEKLDTDANYHRMLRFGMEPEHLGAVRLGIASHNLFTLAYGLVLAEQADRLDHVQFEMLEGMANHQRRALFDLSRNVLLYAPACRQVDFINAVGYLVRRLDENTGPENFLRHAFRLQVDDPAWQQLEQAFVDSFGKIESLPTAPRRTQDRRRQAAASGPRTSDGAPKPVGNKQPTKLSGFRAAGRAKEIHESHATVFVNEPDTDWALPHHSEWAAGILSAWEGRCNAAAPTIPVYVGGREKVADRQQGVSSDPSRPDTVVAQYAHANATDVAEAVACARDDSAGWRRRDVAERREILAGAAEQISAARGEFLGVMLAEGGKTIAESDPEVSEAIDFCRYYGDSAGYFHQLDSARRPGPMPTGKGVVAVVSPWNFPAAIPCGGVAAALAAGNCVILKPASDTVLVAELLCQCFWRAGVPAEALQLLPGSGSAVGQPLVSHDGVDAVVLTGGTETARRILHHKPTVHLLAETGGKNATIVTALADRDLAIKNVLHSAFGHSGQKCSATSLLILEQEVYHDKSFRAALCDAVGSIEVGSAWELSTRMGPLIRPPTGELERSLKELETGEQWAVMPRLHVDDNPHLVSPGVKWGVQPGSFTHCTEFFGPLLGVMEARNLHDAIDLVNRTGYGLTSGLESLDDREHRIWQDGVYAGNLYINRPTTGAIVLRQPFGGMGKSAVGPGVKAGGPNYVATLMNFSQEDDPSDDAAGDGLPRPRWPAFQKLCSAAQIPQLASAIASYEDWAEEEFLSTHDHFRLVGEDNIRSYLPVRALRIRVTSGDNPFEIFARAAAARAIGCRTTVSSPPDLVPAAARAVEQLDQLTSDWAASIEFVEETEDQLAAAVRAGQTDRLRYAHPSRVSTQIRSAAAEKLQYVADAPISPHGRLELLWYCREQSLAHIYHRYGNLGMRGDEARAPTC